MMKTLHQFDQRATNRDGSALIVVLVVIVMLSLGAYTFSELMITEYQAADTYGRQVRAQLWAESGVEYVTTLLTPDGGGFDNNLYDNAGLFHLAMDSDGGFAIVAPLENYNSTAATGQTTSSGLRFGLVDECAKLNVNVLAKFDPESGFGRDLLLGLPNMTEDVADAILDWIDEDDEPREFGAESDSYTLVIPRNGPINSLEELLLVVGVDPFLMYGEDGNRNGVLDPNEDDADQSLPYDNADGVLDLGWSAHLTVSSKEGNFRHAYDRFGEERLNVNEPLLTDLYDLLEEEYGTDIATFITAYRLKGPASASTLEGELDDLVMEAVVPDENPLIGFGDSESTGDLATDQALADAAEGVADALFSGDGGAVTRGGMDLSEGASTEIKSLFELIDAEVVVEIEGQETTLNSPWTSDPGLLQESLPELMDSLTVTTQSEIIGRLNINQARPEVLMGIPGIPADLPGLIVATRERLANDSSQLATSGWLLTQGLVDLEMMRMLDGFITTRGDVMSMQVIGYADRGGPVTRIEAVVDATQEIPQVISQRVLTELGPGYRRDQLPAFGQDASP
ncbi:hypothetical protein AB1L42_06535 [Thalassoglobus sp. JC818]|uniref:hypothetical protein n=1 Tax=Thalassoglobus sp. JC818 TaxID=3232136 RepID=UPI0034582ABF